MHVSESRLGSQLIGKQHGKAFLDSLPDCTVQKGPALRLAKSAEEWLAKGMPEASSRPSDSGEWLRVWGRTRATF